MGIKESIMSCALVVFANDYNEFLLPKEGTGWESGAHGWVRHNEDMKLRALKGSEAHTGLRVERMKKMAEVKVQMGCVTEAIHVFLATDWTGEVDLSKFSWRPWQEIVPGAMFPGDFVILPRIIKGTKCELSVKVNKDGGLEMKESDLKNLAMKEVYS